MLSTPRLNPQRRLKDLYRLQKLLKFEFGNDLKIQLLFFMIRKKLDKALADVTLEHMGIKNPVPGFNIGIPILSSVFLIHQREKEITESKTNRVERYTSESLMDDLMDIGVAVDINYTLVIEQLQNEKYLFIDENDRYHEKRLGAVLIKLFDTIYPTMAGLSIIAYFNQTAEEVESGRKPLELAIAQVSQQLKTEGTVLNLNQARNLNQLDKIDLLGIKKIILTPSQKAQPLTEKNPLTTMLTKRAQKKAEALKTISNQMAAKPYLPILPLNEKLIQHQISQKFSNTLDLSHIILSDVALVLNILKATNLKFPQKKVETISHAIMLLGYEELKDIVTKFESLEIIEERKHLTELQNNYFSAFMAYRIGVNYLSKREIKDFEEISICAMIHNLGQLIVLNYHPEAYFKIKTLMESEKINKRKAAREIIGTTYDNIGIHFAEQWHFSFGIIESLRICYFNRVGKTQDDVLINFPFCATELCAFAGGVLDEKQLLRLRELINSLNMFSKDISTLIDKAWADTIRFSQNHRIRLKKKVLSIIAATG